MRTVTRHRSHPITEARPARRPTPTGHPSNPRVRAQLVSDAVIAGYIHDISVRHRRARTSDETDLPELQPLPTP
jgi:hypothetical protein